MGLKPTQAKTIMSRIHLVEDIKCFKREYTTEAEISLTLLPGTLADVAIGQLFVENNLGNAT